MIPINTKPNIFYSSKEYVATVTDTDTLADGFYGTVILNKGTSFTVTLGAAANNSERTVKFINIGAGTVTISDGGTVATLEQNETCAVTCNGSDWYSASGHIRLHSMDDSDDHDAASASDYGKNVRANPSTGAIEFSDINSDDIVEGDNKFVTAADITNLGNLSGENTGDQTKITDILTLDATAISNKYIDLTHVPLDATAVGLFPIGGIKQLYTIYFTVITDGADIKRLNWGSLGLEALLAEGDIISSDYIY